MRPPRIGRPKTVCAEHELPQYPQNPGNEAHHVWTRPNNGFCGCFEERTEITTTTVQWPSQFCSLQNAFSATSFRVIFRDILSHFELRLMRLSQSKLFCPSLSRVEPFSLPHAYVYVNLTSPAASLLDIAQSGNILREQGPKYASPMRFHWACTGGECRPLSEGQIHVNCLLPQRVQSSAKSCASIFCKRIEKTPWSISESRQRSGSGSSG